jgi:hypothetical protein
MDTASDRESLHQPGKGCALQLPINPSGERSNYKAKAEVITSLQEVIGS